MSSIHSRLRRLGAVIRAGALPAGACLVALSLPATLIALTASDWFQQWTNGAPMMASGESIGSLPAYLTPSDEVPVPGASAEQNALQAEPAIQIDVPHEYAFSSVPYAQGAGYAFVGPSPLATANARVRLFGTLDAKAPLNAFDGRNNSLSWRVGNAFAGSKLVTASATKTTISLLPPNATTVPLPVDQWKSALQAGPMVMTLVGTSGQKAMLVLTADTDMLSIAQFVP